MYKNKSVSGNNISGDNIKVLRKSSALSQRELADAMQLLGLDIDKNAVSRIENGKRFVTDIELKAFALFFHVTADALLSTLSL